MLQARTLEWAAMPSSRGSPRPRDRTHVSYSIEVQAGRFITTSTSWKALDFGLHSSKPISESSRLRGNLTMTCVQCGTKIVTIFTETETLL